MGCKPILRQFRPFQLFQHRRFQLLAVFSREFSDLRPCKFGEGLAFIRRVARRQVEDLGLPFACTESGGRNDPQNR